MNEFLPCSPVNYQEFLPLADFLLDDFAHVADLGGMEEDLTGKYITETDEFYVDLMDFTSTKHQEELFFDVTKLSNDDEKPKKDDNGIVIEDSSCKNSACLDDSPQNVDTCVQLSISDDALSLSSVSKVFTSAMHNSKNETFCNLKAFLQKDCSAFPSVTMSTSEEDSTLNSSNSSVVRSSADKEVCLSVALANFEPVVILNEEGSNKESDEFSEPAEKIQRLDVRCSSKCRDAKYADMRRKNNVASQRSRRTKKLKEKEFEEKAVALEKENEALRTKEEKLQEIVNKLKEMLFNSINAKK